MAGFACMLLGYRTVSSDGTIEARKGICFKEGRKNADEIESAITVLQIFFLHENPEEIMGMVVSCKQNLKVSDS